MQRINSLSLRVHFFLRTRKGRIMAALVGLALVVSAISFTAYENSHDIPNPIWATLSNDYSYSANGPLPGPGLLDVRPERIVAQYIHDYTAIAGTFPCSQNLASYKQLGEENWYDWHDGDPVLDKRPCSVHRPVMQVQLGEVDISNFHESVASGSSNGAVYYVDALVSYQVSYANGQRFTSKVELEASSDNGHIYYGFSAQSGFVTHINCWQSLDISHFYAIYSFPKPTGVAHDLTNWGTVACY